MRVALLLALLLIAVPAVTIAAQPMPGRDIIIANSGSGVPGLFHISRDGKKFGTILTVPAQDYPNWVEMWSDNQHLAVVFTQKSGSQTGSALWKVNQAGVVTTIFSGFLTGSSPNAIDLTEDGAAWYVSSVGANAVFKISSQGARTTLGTVIYPNGLCLDPDTGDLMVGGSTSYPAPPTLPTPGTGFLMRWDAKTGAVKSTVATGILRLTSVYPDRIQGGWFISRFDQDAVLHVGAGGQVTTVLTGSTWHNAVKMDEDGTLWSMDTTTIMHYDRKGTVITSFALPVISAAMNGLAFWGSRVLTGTGVAKPGATYGIQVRSVKGWEAGRAYVLAASLATRPGIRLPDGRWIHLFPDVLFGVTAQNRLPMIFQGFTGTLDVFGSARAGIALPASFPPNTGIRIHVQGVIVDPGAPSGISSVTNAIHVTLE